MSFPTLKINQSKYLYDVFCNVVVNLTCSQDITQTLPKAINSQGIECKPCEIFIQDQRPSFLTLKILV